MSFNIEEYRSYLHDESKLEAKTIDKVFFPKSETELAEFIKDKVGSSYLITISGARTGLTGGAVPLGDDSGRSHALVSLERLKKIYGIEEAEGKKYVRVQCGVTLLQLSEYLKENCPDYFFPVDPTERSASFGGMIATNAGGARSFRYGSMRAWVEEIRVVLASGLDLKVKKRESKLSDLPVASKLPNIVSLEKPRIKNAIGPDLSPEMDLVDLFIGAEGVFGVVTEALIRLEKIPENIVGFLQFFKSEEIALNFVSQLRDSYRGNLLSVEYFDDVSIQYALKSKKPFGNKISDILSAGVSSGVFFELDLDSYEGDLDQFFESYMSLVLELSADPEQCIMASDFTELEEVKSFRHAVPEQINACIAERKKTHSALRKVATDMAVPDRYLKEVFKVYRSKFSEKNLEFAIFGHIGDNHLHVNVLPRDEVELARALDAYKEIAGEVVKMGGVVSAEHGIGRLKKAFFREQFSEEQLDQFREIKRVLDPELKLNIGVLFDM